MSLIVARASNRVTCMLHVLEDSIAEIFEAKLQVGTACLGFGPCRSDRIHPSSWQALGLQEEILKTRSGRTGDVAMPSCRLS